MTWTRTQHAHHWPRMVKLARRYVGENDAEDVAQTALLHTLTAKFRGDSELATWLHRIVVNASLDALRATRRCPVETVVILPETEDNDTPEQAAMRAERSLALTRAIGRLHRDHRDALCLALRMDHYSDIAHTLGIPEGTVKSRIHRARDAVRRLMP